MKKIFFVALASLSIYSCVSVRFPETIKVDITVPEDFNVEQMKILIDTLKGNKVDGTIEVLLHKKSEN
jgi:hypothetical protein